MKQRAHAWVALRALKFVDDLNRAPRLVELMSYYLSDAWDGAWLPDTLIRDMGYGHVFKMDDDPDYLEYDIASRDYRKKSYTSLKKSLAGKRLCLSYAKDSDALKAPCWVHDQNGGNLPDRVIAISHSIGDMLKMSDYPMAFYASKKRSKAYLDDDLSSVNVKDLTLSPNFSARQIALMLFMVSHYICDAHMPLHCDYRDYGSPSQRRVREGLHASIEAKWEKSFPDKEAVMLHDYAKTCLDDIAGREMPAGSIIEIDTDGKYGLSCKLSRLKGNEWDEMVNVCRVSYAVSRKWIGGGLQDADEMGQEEFREVTNCVFHDAVECVARIWLKIWDRFVF